MNEKNDIKFNILFDSAFNLLQSIDNSRKYSDQLLDDITKENSEFKQNNKVFKKCNYALQELIEKVDETIIDSIDNKSHSIARNIVKSLHEEFNGANKYANEAAEIYKKASNKVIYKVTSLSFIIFLFLSCITYFGYTYFLQEKYNKLQADIAYLEINKQKLIDLGARTTIIKYDGELYVRVKSNKTWTFNDNKQDEYALIK